MAEVLRKSKRKRNILEPLLLIEVTTIQKLVGNSPFASRWKDFLLSEFNEIVSLCVSIYTGNVSQIIKSVGKAIKTAIAFYKENKQTTANSELTFMLIFDKFENTLINESDKMKIGEFVSNLLTEMKYLSQNQQIISLEFITSCIIKDTIPKSVFDLFFEKLEVTCQHRASPIRAQSAQILRLMRSSLRRAEGIYKTMKRKEKDKLILAILELEPIKIEIAGDELEETNKKAKNTKKSEEKKQAAIKPKDTRQNEEKKKKQVAIKAEKTVNSTSTESCNLTCDNNHPLKYFNDTSKYYKSRTGIGGDNIGCNNCGNTFNGGSWHCRPCTYDLCSNCKNSADVQTKSRKSAKSASTEDCNLTCARNHPLKYYNDTSKYYKSMTGIGGDNIGCDYCGITFNGGSWHCRPCTYDLCDSCKENNDDSNESEEIGNWSSDSDSEEDRGVTCDNNHRLQCGDCGGYTCDICWTKKSGTTWYCLKCNYTLCIPCYKSA